LINEEAFGDDLSDAALEAAGGKYWEVGNPFTIAFCTGRRLQRRLGKLLPTFRVGHLPGLTAFGRLTHERGAKDQLSGLTPFGRALSWVKQTSTYLNGMSAYDPKETPETRSLGVTSRVLVPKLSAGKP